MPSIYNSKKQQSEHRSEDCYKIEFWSLLAHDMMAPSPTSNIFKRMVESLRKIAQGLLFSSLIAAIPSMAWCNQPKDFAKSVDFSRDILPLLSNKCFVCHGPSTDNPDQLRLDSQKAATANRGGYRAVDQDNPSNSEILERIYSASDPMPPVDADKQLTTSERNLIARWIQEGGKYSRHWAFVPPKLGHPRSSPNAQRNEIIDAFILDGLQAAGIDFAPEADLATLARRVSLVLTGLPPDLDELNQLLHDNKPGAYGRYVDVLLASPRFGEHQARYWLDAVRYGDTHGLHLDNRRGIYPYRDWVINAFNNNLPLDQFITWQLAGDLLPDPTLAQQVATGFVRMNPSTGEGGAIPEEFQVKNNFDRTETLGTVLLGMTLTCARCHTHKYDPITQTEYYRLLAFFNSTTEHSLDGNSYNYHPAIEAPSSQAGWVQWNQFESLRTELISQVEILFNNKSSLSDETALKWKNSKAADKLDLIADGTSPFGSDTLSPKARELIVQFADAKQYFTTTLVAQDMPTMRITKVLERGEYHRPIGEPLEPGTPHVMGQFPENLPRNRLGLAQWLIDPNHPLVTRVLVNRIWQRTFGDGLVRTPEDFGLQGEQPTHPELLDWLAVDLYRSDWDLKNMLRFMVNSRTFRQQSAWRKDVDDPANRLFARGPRYRLDAEVLRDIGLWASGLLDPQQGGEGVKPYQPLGMWKALAHPSSNTREYVADQGLLLYRRSIYVYWKRTSPHPMMTLFDAPNRESSCVKRSRTNTALQSLGLLNETQRIEMARSLAERLLLEANTDEERLHLLFRLLASRDPNGHERTACLTLLNMLHQKYSRATEDALAFLSTGEAEKNSTLDPAAYAAWTQVAVTVLASDPAILLY